MKIQVIGYNCTQKLNTDLDVDYTILGRPNSLDEYDINIINLQNENIWRNAENTNASLNSFSDFKSLSTMLLNSIKAKNIIALPQNYTFKYDHGPTGYGNSEYRKRILLKDMLYEMTDKLLFVLTREKFDNRICYENTNTICDGESFSAAFYFNGLWSSLSLSDKSEKKTTISVGNVIYTTLDICNQTTNLDNFLSGIKILSTTETFPEWLYEVYFNDDEEQIGIIDRDNEKIELLQKEVEESKQRLQNNMHYKSILSTNGDKLVRVVFEILEKILDCDLSDFNDEKKEDFLIKLPNITFIGEIKGVTSNVKSEHVSQVDVHYHSYEDKLQEEGIAENVKQILIINPFRTKELAQREEVHTNQINLAKRNGCLIISTETLLYIFEKFLKNEFSVDHVTKILADNEGILTKEMLDIQE